MKISPSKSTVLITGGSGFAGRNLADLLASKGHSVHLLDKVGTLPGNLKHKYGKSITVHRVDITAPRGLPRLLDTINPEEIYHLAGIANVKHSWEGEAITYRVNVIGAVQLLSAIKHTNLASNILIVGSGEVYGYVDEKDQPILETHPTHPGSPYAASKLCQEIAVKQMSAHIKGKVVFVRPFNHIGPGQHPSFVAPDFARQVARIERGQQEPVIRVGNLSAYRDFSDVRDTVSGYVMALRHGKNLGIYNVSSQQTIAIQNILDSLLSLSEHKITVKVDPNKFRPADVPKLCGSSELLRKISGWTVKKDINQTLIDILEYWRSHPGE